MDMSACLTLAWKAEHVTEQAQAHGIPSGG